MKSAQRLVFFKKIFKQAWLTQGLNAVPLYLTTAAASGHRMKKYLGFNYSPYLFYYKNNYAEGSYNAKDFPKLWRIMGRRLYNSAAYLNKIRHQYNSVFKAYESWFKTIRQADLSKFDDQQLLTNFIKAGHSLIESIDLAHVIEIVSIGLETDLKQYLSKKYTPQQVNQKMRELANYYKTSFINQEESDLAKLLKYSGQSLKKHLVKHAEKYYWFRANYTGAEIVDTKYLLGRLKQLSKHNNFNSTNGVKIASLGNDKQLNKYIKLIVEIADWQDERKVNIFKAIYHTQLIVNEVSQRLNISVSDLHYLASFELLNLKQLSDIKKLKSVLAERRHGCFDYISYQTEILISGREFKILEPHYHSVRGRVGTVPLTIEGTVANSGRAMGVVKICKSLKDMNIVEPGNIMVTSMTRPEYLSAMKKVAAIVTDEGGITCHAAIVSRELGIPCIIGTKIATKALKNGDMVEVNANHGVVKLINNN